MQEKVLSQFYSDASTTIVIILLNILSLFIRIIIGSVWDQQFAKFFLTFHVTHY